MLHWPFRRIYEDLAKIESVIFLDASDNEHFNMILKRRYKNIYEGS